MKALHTITGTPRSGSTLLRNILAQNPAFHVSSTSPVARALFALQQVASTSDEVKSELITDGDGSRARMLDAFRGYVDGWYSAHADQICFDTGRGWAAMAQLHAQLYPSGRQIVCVRDLRAVFASVEKQHARYPLLNPVENLGQLTVADRARRLFAPDGLIGTAVVGVEDILRRGCANAVLVQYEWFVQEPEQALRRIYAALGVAYWEGHDFAYVERATEEVDALYLDKFPHEGSGAVTAPEPDEWRRWCPPDIAGDIMANFPGYNRAFGYAAQ